MKQFDVTQATTPARVDLGLASAAPAIVTCELVRRLQRAEHTRRISESTVAGLRRVVEVQLVLAAPIADTAT